MAGAIEDYAVLGNCRSAALVGGFVLLGVVVLRRRGKKFAGSSGLSADEQQRLAALLSQRPTNQTPQDKKDR